MVKRIEIGQRRRARQLANHEMEASSTHSNELPPHAVVNADMVFPTMTFCNGEISTVIGAERVAWCERRERRG